MIIQDEIESVVNTLVVEATGQPPIFIHGNSGWQNLLSDEILTDLVLLDPVTSNDTHLKSGYLDENYNIAISFLTKSEFEFTPEQHKPLVARMRDQRRKFIDKLSKHTNNDRKVFKDISNIKTIDVVNLLNKNVSGVLVLINIKLVNPLPNC